ncbi:uncharacterized protein LOC124133829 [Haliotis rufescens]|uniref:uncharacterized protein LOC124133829 n=1 Tax=Haliotis rufescens TaxID=6454 RepID=UPI001EAFEB30|nr:uncharacterized protein LOC124133829 [Haliotis rufescens]
MSDEDMKQPKTESTIMKTIRAPKAPQSPDPSFVRTEDLYYTLEPPMPPQKLNRTPMGDYIVPQGGTPLTSLGDHVPGPADYTPKIDLTRKSAPQYSLVGRLKKHIPTRYPGPADYPCGANLIWNHRTVTLKGRVGKSYLEEKGASDIGPAMYDTMNPMGSCGPCFSMASKHTCIDVVSGPPDDLVQPVDTHGFETPGPDFRPNSGYWGRGPKKSFGSRRPVFFQDKPGPGPGDYDIPDSNRGPSYSLARRLNNSDETTRRKKKKDPAPNTYDVGSTIGKTVAISIAGRRKEHPKSIEKAGPAANAYTLKTSFDPFFKAATMSYRWFDVNAPIEPGPADYHVRNVTLRKDPVFTCRQRCKPSFPDPLSYPTVSPGPGKYNVRKETQNNDDPAFSMGSRRTNRQKGGGPAPNQYSVEKFQKPGAERAPAFTMGRRFESPDSKVSPGPAAYNLQTTMAGGPRYTMSKRLPKYTTGVIIPAPNAYRPPSAQTYKGLRTKLGLKLKSRASPFVYSGFKTNRIVDPVA